MTQDDTGTPPFRALALPSPTPERRDDGAAGHWSPDGNWWFNGSEWIANPYRQQAG